MKDSMGVIMIVGIQGDEENRIVARDRYQLGLNQTILQISEWIFTGVLTLS